MPGGLGSVKRLPPHHLLTVQPPVDCPFPWASLRMTLLHPTAHVGGQHPASELEALCVSLRFHIYMKGMQTLSLPHSPNKIKRPRTSLVVQWLRLHSPNERGLGSILGQGARSHVVQLRSSAGKLIKKKKKRPVSFLFQIYNPHRHLVFREGSWAVGQDKQHEQRIRRVEAWLCGREVNFLTCSNTRAKSCLFYE